MGKRNYSKENRKLLWDNKKADTKEIYHNMIEYPKAQAKIIGGRLRNNIYLKG